MKAEEKEMQGKSKNHRGIVVTLVKKVTNTDRNESSDSENISSR